MNFIDNAAVDVRLGDYKMTNAVTPNEGLRLCVVRLRVASI